MKEYVKVKYWFEQKKELKADGSEDMRYKAMNEGWRIAIMTVDEAFEVIKNRTLCRVKYAHVD